MRKHSEYILYCVGLFTPQRLHRIGRCRLVAVPTDGEEGDEGERLVSPPTPEDHFEGDCAHNRSAVSSFPKLNSPSYSTNENHTYLPNLVKNVK